jgi:hypothetical protein
MTIQRTQGPAPEKWWETGEPPVAKTSDGYTEDAGLVSLGVLAESLYMIKSAIGDTDKNLAEAVRYLVESMDTQGLVDTVALIQDMKRALGVAEAYVSREVGYLVQEQTSAKTGETSDGRHYEVMRGNERKAWDHQGWQRDLRAAIIEGSNVSPNLVDPATGEQVSLVGMMTLAEEAHGSTAPKTTILKRWKVDPDDYCESVPGPYSVKITQTTTTPGD